MRSKGLLRDTVSNRRGAAAALIALAMPVLLGLVALGVDLGMMFSARAESQRATDAGALAGAAKFFDFPTTPGDAVGPAEAEAFAFTEKNAIRHEGIDSVAITVEVNPDSQMVRVTATRTVDTWFAKIFGVNTVQVSTISVAHLAESGSARCVKPFAIPDLWDETVTGTGSYDNEADLQPFGNGHQVWDIRDAGGNFPSGKGNASGLYENWMYDSGENYGGADQAEPAQTGWGTTARDGVTDLQGNVYKEDFGREMLVKFQDPSGSDPSHWLPFVVPGYGTGGAAFRENITSCRSTEFVIGDSIQDEPGLMPEPTWKAFEELLNKDASATWTPTTYVDAQGNTITTGTVTGSHHGSNWLDASDRVVIVPLVKPDGIQSGRNEMEVADFARIFLEWPTPRDKTGAITARFLGFVPGTGAGPTAGSNVRYLRLIDDKLWVAP